ncbi:MAG: acyl-CoA thioesterase [Nitrospinota bacterium]|nr:acyl-CoA thioesterase [Nitrospinota bacterium]
MNTDSEDVIPLDRQPDLRVLAMPRDANSFGDIFGGWIMAQVDIAGAVVASKKVKGRVVTVAVTEFQFKKPVFVGDLVSCFGEIVKIGKTSITVDVCVYAERGMRAGETIKVTEAQLVYVAVNPNGEPIPIPA